MPHLEFSDLTLLLVQIATIVVVSRTLGAVTRWLGQPLVIAEVLAGILLGPSLLGWLWPDAMVALFPAKSLPPLKMLSQVGLVLFMFLIGLEFDQRLLRGRTHTSVVISHTSIVVPFALGAGSAWYLYEAYSPPTVSFLSFTLFLGISMSVTAFPVLARILSERNLLHSRVGAISLACAAVDDVTAWCMLAFVVAVARSRALVQALWTTGFAILFILTMLFLIRPFLRRLGARVASREALTPTLVAIILILLMISSITTELIGIHALFGAFLFGAILPKDGKLAETLVEKLETAAVVLFLPLFFAYSGLRTEIGLVSGREDWLVAGFLILIATVGKFGGSAIAARLTGLRWREATALGILMNTRGLMELIVLNIGFDIGVISPTMFTMLVMMALVTTFATTPVLHWVYPDSELQRDRLVVPTEVAAGEAAAFTVMMCVSDPTHGPGMATLSAALLGGHSEPARMFAVHLWHPSDRLSVERRRAGPDEEIDPLRPLMRRARNLMLEVRPVGFVSNDPAEDICRTADEMRASLVLLGAHKPLLLEGDLGGTVRDVMDKVATPVGVFVDRGLIKVSRVLVAYAGGPEDAAAIEVARRLAANPDVSLTVLHADTKRAENSVIEEFFGPSGAREGAISLRVIEPNAPAEVIMAEAAANYDLVIIGLRQQWGFDTGVLSLKRRGILTDTPISILAVHSPKRPPR